MPRRKQQAPRRASAYIDDDEFAEDCAHEEESGEASEDDPRIPSPSQGLEQQQQQEHEPLALRALTQTRDNRCDNIDSNGNHHLVQGSDDEGDNNNDVDDDDDGGGGGGDDDEGMNNHSHNHNHHHHHHHRSRSSNSSSSSSNNKTKNGISSQMNNSGSSNNANGGNGNDIDDDDDDDDDGGGEMEDEAEEEEEEMVDDDGDVDDDRGVALEKETTAAAAADGGVGAPPAKSAPHFCSGSSSNGQTDSDKAGRRRAAKQEEEAAAATTTNAEEEEEDKKKDPVSPSVIEDSLSQMKAAYANFLSSSYWSTVGSFSYAQPNGAGGGGGGGGAGANFDWHRAAVAKSLQQATSPSTPSPLYAHDQQCGLFSSVQLYRQSSKLYSPVFTGASKFRCRDCSAAYDRLVDLTVHMSETGHYRDESMRAANGGGTDGSGNRQAWSKPRKRSLMEIEGKEEAQKVLRCLCCGHAFESLQDLSVHMIRTKHYQKVPLREPMAALTAKPCHATKKRPHLETTAAAVVAAAAERACSSPESTVSDAAATPPADQLSGNHKGQVLGSNCPARSSSTTANTTTTTSSSHHHHHHQNGTSYSWQFESQKAHILKCMECGSSHDTLQQLTAHMMATGHFIKLTAPANSSSSSSLLLARKSKQVNFEAHAADDKVQSVHLGATSKLGAVPPPAVAAVKVERQSARDGDRHAAAEGKKANVKDKKSEQREKRETSAAAAEKGVTSPSPDLPKHQEADLPSQFDYLKEEDLSESSKEGGLDILKSLEHTVASIISKAQNGSGSWGGYPSIHAAYQLPGHVARPAHAPSVAPSKLVTRDDLELQQQQRQQHRHHHRRQQPSPPPSRSHMESSSSSPSSSAATTPSPPASPHGAKVPPLVPSPPVQPLPSNVRAMEELVRKMTEKVNSSSAPSSSSSPFSAASSLRMTRDASESKGAPPRTAGVVAGKREARDDKGHAAARGAELFGGRDVKWDLGQELRRKASHEARRGAGARDARERHGREAQRLGGGGERLRDVKVERTIEVKSEATRGASPPAGVEASAVCLKVEGAQGAGRRDGSCTAAANAAEVAVATTGGANKTCEARNGKSADEKPFSSSSSSSSSCTPPGFSSLSIITEHSGEPCLVNPLSALQSVMNAHLGKAAKPLSPALLDPLSRLHRLGGSSLDRPRSAAAVATALPASLGHARHADGAAGGDERAPSFSARGEPSSDQPMDLTKSKPASAATERCRAGGSVAAMPLMLAASPAGENALSDISDLVRNLAGRLTPKPPTPSSATSSVAASDRSDGGDACGGGAPDEDAAEAERGPLSGGAGGGSAASADVSGKQRKAGRQSAWNPRHLLLLQAQFAASLRQTADGRYVISDLSPQERLNVARATGLSASTISHWLANVKYQLRRTGGTKFLKHMDTGRPVFYCCDCAMQFRTPPAYVGHAEAHLGFGLRDLSKMAVVERTGAEGLAVGSQQAASPSPPPPSVAAAAAVAAVAATAAAAAAGPRDEPECGAPCRCQLCGRSFSSRHAVKLHLSKAHSKSPEDHVMFVSDVAADQPAPQPQA